MTCVLGMVVRREREIREFVETQMCIRDRLKTMQFNKDRMEESAKHGFTNATDAADYLVNHGVPFRDAHGIVGKLVLTCICLLYTSRCV